VLNTQKAYAKALLVDRAALAKAQAATDVIQANRALLSAFELDVEPLLARVRVEMGRDPDPLDAHRRSGYAAKVAAARQGRGVNTLGGG
jgi:L-rhamnose isomerase/sugar isomerase